VADYIPTGSIGLDVLLGGGWQRGYIHEIWGEPGSGKTTVAEHAIWENVGGKSLWISLGTEVPHRPADVLFAQPRNAEQAFVVMQTCVLGDVSLIVVDSANGLIRQRELDGDPDYTPHPQREYRDELTRLKEYCKGSGATVIFLSKPRDRDRQPVRGTGISEKARSRVMLSIWHQKQDDSRMVKAVVKDDECLIPVQPGTGIDWANELTATALRYGVIERDGSWISYGDETFHGFPAFAKEVGDNTKLAVELDGLIRLKAGIATTGR
jgi:recombination protein RecA